MWVIVHSLILQCMAVDSLVNMLSNIQKDIGPQELMTRTQGSKIWNGCRVVHYKEMKMMIITIKLKDNFKKVASSFMQNKKIF